MSTADRPFILPETFDALPTVVAGFSTRHGGVSPAPFHALNLGLSTGDADENVLENRRLLFESVGFDLEQLAVAGQVHGADVKEVTEPGLYKGFDGMVTRESGILLCISAADCLAVLLVDPEAGVVGACHSGWRGTVAEISVRTVEAMQRLSAAPERMHAYVSPCISKEHFEVGHEVAAQFDAAFVVSHPGREKPHVDLKAAVADQLQRAGVPQERTEVAPHCTYGQTEDFFSYRAEDGLTGRMMGFIGMKSPR